MKPKRDAKNCFVIAPIGKPESKTRERSDDLFRCVIAPVTNEMGYLAKRADLMAVPGLIMRQVVQAVIESQLVIADLSEHNPNVFYELSLRHAIGKPIVHVIQIDDEIPFDLQDFRTVRYDPQRWGSLDDTRSELREHIRATEQADYRPVSPISAAVDLAQALSGNRFNDEDLQVVLSGVLDQLDATQRTLNRLDFSLASLNAAAPLRSYSGSDSQDIMFDVLASLSPRERKIISMLHGLDGKRIRDLREVAKEFGLPREVIEETYATALRKLRHPSRSRRLFAAAALPPEERLPDGLLDLISTLVAYGDIPLVGDSGGKGAP